MNIFRLQRKSKKKIKFKTLILFIFTLIMTSFAWFAYSKILNTTIDIHVASWDMEYSIGGVEKTNPIGIDILTVYPAMEEQVVTIDIKNNGETLVDISYEVEAVTIAGTSYEVIKEGETNTSPNYIVLAEPVMDSVTGTDPITGLETIEYIYKGVITSDIEKFPFTIDIEHSAQVDAINESDEPGEGYLKITVNWEGDNNELDTQWGYIVGEYLTNNPGATSVMSIQLSINSYQAERLIQEVTQEMPSTAQTSPYLPTGFTRVPGTTLDVGLVIQDPSGNQYVWIEVPKNTTVYSADTLLLDLDNLTGTALTNAYTKIEEELNTYTATYDTRADQYVSYSAIGLSESNYNSLKKKMLKSVFQKGGFYIGRYETGIADSSRTSATTPTETAVIKANAYPYNWVTCSQAQELATGMASGSNTSSLMFGLQWDLVLKYLETKGSASAELKTNSTTWGNYKNNTYLLTRANSEYLLNTEWLASPYEKDIDVQALLTTGASSTLSKQNIYDLAGNLSEWTFNIGASGGTAFGGNGGDYLLEGTNPANYRASYNTGTGAKHIGFRVTIY